MDEYYAYIDEAGDEGFGKLRSAPSGGQSTWLLIGAILVAKENDHLLPQWRDEILTQFPSKSHKRDLHFVKLKHEQRVAACRLLAEKRFGACVICSDKRQILLLKDTKPELYEKYKTNGHLYNYLVRFCLERLTAACAIKSRGKPCKLYVTFSKRHSTNYQAMRDYLYLMRDDREVIKPVRSINWNVLNPEDIRVENHSNRAGLQLADVITSATYQAFQENLYGDVETRYISILDKRFLKENNSIRDCGITLVPKSAQPHSDTKRMLIRMK